MYDIIELFQGLGLNAFKRGDAQHHIVTQTFTKMVENVAGMVILEVNENGGDDLWMLVLDQVGDGGRIHPFQAVEACGFTARHDA